MPGYTDPKGGEVVGSCIFAFQGVWRHADSRIVVCTVYTYPRDRKHGHVTKHGGGTLANGTPPRGDTGRDDLRREKLQPMIEALMAHLGGEQVHVQQAGNFWPRSLGGGPPWAKCSSKPEPAASAELVPRAARPGGLHQSPVKRNGPPPRGDERLIIQFAPRHPCAEMIHRIFQDACVRCGCKIGLYRGFGPLCSGCLGQDIEATHRNFSGCYQQFPMWTSGSVVPWWYPCEARWPR